MKLKNFKDKKVTIIGLGLHGGGIGVAKFFSQLGAKVLVTDLRSKEELKESLEKLKGKSIKYVLNQHRPEDFINTDLVIKNPAVPGKSKYLQIAKEHGIPIETDIGIFFELCPAPIIGITGSKGKSTVATLIAKFLARKYPKVVLAGNIRTSVLRKLKKIDKETLVVLELSSWQLAGLKPHGKSPDCSLITNILPDHLNRYRDINEYIEDKKLIFKFQKSKNTLILNYDDEVVRNFAKEAKSEVIYYGQEYETDKLPEIRNEIQLKGEHNLSNVLAAIAVAKLYNISDKSIKKVLRKFKGIEGRLELVRIINGIKYINDTTATIPEATLAALNSFPLNKQIILIAGGNDKNLNFSQLAEMINKRVKSLILLEGTATDKLQKEMTKSQVEIVGPFNDMEQAVSQAQARAEESASGGDIVLLSPAATSFGLFRHEFERGDAFIKAVENL